MFQLFLTFLCAVALGSAVLAQDISIAQPKADAIVTAGSDIIVQLDKPMSLTGSEDIAVVIGVFPCGSGICPKVSDVLGDVLYKGTFSPVSHDDDHYPYEQFKVTVPSWYKGPVQLGVAHFFLLGAGLSPELQFTNLTLNVVD